MLERLPDGKCSRWNDLWSHTLFYDEKCESCKSIVKIGRRKFCGYTPPRVSLHQIIRSQIGCIGIDAGICKNYVKRLDCTACMECLERHQNAEPFSMMRVRKDEQNENT